MEIVKTIYMILDMYRFLQLSLQHPQTLINTHSSFACAGVQVGMALQAPVRIPDPS